MNTYTVNYDDLENRIDPYFYHPFFKALSNKLRKSNHKRLNDVVSFSDETWNQKDLFEKRFPYIEISEIDTLSGEIKNIIYYDKKEAPSRAKVVVRDKDILVSTTRPHRGAVSLIDKTKDGFIASTGFAVLRSLKTADINRSYLYYFLRTSLALNQMLQRSSGGSYPAITTEELKRLIVPILSPVAQNKIVKIMQSAYKEREEKLKQADELLNSIDETVLDFLNVTIPQRDKAITFTVRLEAENGKRLDPRYHQPFFNDFEKQLDTRQDTKKLTEISSYIGSGATPRAGGSAYVAKNEGIPFIRITNIKNNTIVIDDDTLYIKREIHEGMLRRTVLQPNDILLSMAGTIGVSVVVPSNLGEANINQALARIVINENANSHYISAILSSPIGKIQTDRLSRPSVQANINLQEIGELKIPLPPRHLQDEIVNVISERVKNSEKLRIEAERILKQAKEKVEEMILN